MKFHITRTVFICSIITMLAIEGCATAGRNFEISNIHEIEINRTRESTIRHWFGEPYVLRTVRHAGFETRILEYLYAKVNPMDGITHDRELFIEVSGDFVYSYWFLSSFQEDTTDFNTEIRNQLIIGETTMSDIDSLLGKPGGKYQLPSNLLPDKVANDAPKGTKIIWMYYSQGVGKGYMALRENIKLLILFFDESNVLIDWDFTDSSVLH